MARVILWPMIYMFLLVGEEFGWRAYLLPKLMPLGPRKAVLLSGALWAVSHWPLILMGFSYGLNYWGAPVVGSLLFVWCCLLTGTFLAWVTLRSGSVWPAALGHAVMNAPGMLMASFIFGEPDILIGPVAVGTIGSFGEPLSILQMRALLYCAAPSGGARAAT